MTAINPARLKMQVTKLGELIAQPAQFKTRLHDLLNFYSARIRQSVLTRTPLSLQSYQVPEPVIQSLENEIKERIEGNFEAGFELADSLWAEPWIEFQRLAIHILGNLPLTEPEMIMDRIDSWLSDCPAEEIRHRIMTVGSSKMALEAPEQSLSYIDRLIQSGIPKNHQSALFGLELFVLDNTYPNLPLIYQHLSQILRAEEAGLVKEISGLLNGLIIRSEQETAYFLAQEINLASKPRIVRVIRGVINQFSPDNQALIKGKLETIQD